MSRCHNEVAAPRFLGTNGQYRREVVIDKVAYAFKTYIALMKI